MGNAIVMFFWGGLAKQALCHSLGLLEATWDFATGGVTKIGPKKRDTYKETHVDLIEVGESKDISDRQSHSMSTSLVPLLLGLLRRPGIKDIVPFLVRVRVSNLPHPLKP
ncbi:Hypothetical predicted protein [Prunus dulcis]|uniref:Uncharacterized protein n=1 Tax=Prunus dulcis TaxID=3755 RepID=A0A5E4FNE5_PRUDU|nr:hypothetical protein L3X38_002589 [Prunus dulcis]VVA28980.1 Hypothetical predicted protein [Prunus dulcis]